MSNWHAKPSGGYAENSDEYIDNVKCIDDELADFGFRANVIAGICGNIYAESAMNPWRWQSDTYNRSGGYGLFQFTPATKYIDSGFSGIAPNLSTSSVTEGAEPEDGAAQCRFFGTDHGNNWVARGWRSYWSKTVYPEMWNKWVHTCVNYGVQEWVVDHIEYSMPFDNIIDADMTIEAATIAFLACYEGPLVPNFAPRIVYAENAARYIDGATTKKIPVWLLWKISRGGK